MASMRIEMKWARREIYNTGQIPCSDVRWFEQQGCENIVANAHLSKYAAHEASHHHLF